MGSQAVADGSVLVLGGRSEIGLKVAQRLAPGRVVILAARRSGGGTARTAGGTAEAPGAPAGEGSGSTGDGSASTGDGGGLAEEAALVLAAGATAVHRVEFDADDTAGHSAFLEKVVAEHGRIGVAVLAFGILGDQALAERDPAHALAVLHTDFSAQVSVLTVLANLLRAQGSGQIVVFSSVAGIRVRKANYVYGSAKAGLDGFANGLADALHGSGVHLLLVRPGFVIGRMTEGMSPAPLPSTPDQVADAVAKGLRSGRARVWVPGLLRPAYFVARLVPQAVWRKMPR